MSRTRYIGTEEFMRGIRDAVDQFGRDHQGYRHGPKRNDALPSLIEFDEAARILCRQVITLNDNGYSWGVILDVLDGKTPCPPLYTKGIPLSEFATIVLKPGRFIPIPAAPPVEVEQEQELVGV